MPLSKTRAKRLLKLLPQSNLSDGKKRKLALFLAAGLAGEQRTEAIMRQNEPERDDEEDALMEAELTEIFTRREAGNGLLELSDDEWRNLDTNR